jgi:hypothetical protein
MSTSLAKVDNPACKATLTGLDPTHHRTIVLLVLTGISVKTIITIVRPVSRLPAERPPVELRTGGAPQRPELPA